MCGCPIYPGHGSTFVRNDSKIFRYCSKKCRNLFRKKVNPRRLKWSKHFRRTHGRELNIDSTFDFEKQRNTPIKYDRELYSATIRAMKRISEIQQARQRNFYFKRMTVSLKNRKMKIRRDLKKNLDLVVAPVAKERAAIVQRLEQVAMQDQTLESSNQPNKKMIKNDNVTMYD
jgi:large subunit ribosomal protein L24e